MIRSKKELGQILLDNQISFNSGLCNWVNMLRLRKLITDYEVTYLSNLIYHKRPVFIPLINNIYNPNKKLYNNGFFWGPGHIEPRIKWIKKHLMK